jgi:hypothetical protein
MIRFCNHFTTSCTIRPRNHAQTGGSRIHRPCADGSSLEDQSQTLIMKRQGIFLLLLLCTVAVQAQQWKPAPVPLKTQWGERVAPDNAWREYPRPQFVRERWQNLNGLWEYAITAKTAPAPAKFDGQLLVPFAVEASLSGVGKVLQPDQRLWYRRSFGVPAAWKGERILLNFGAVDYECVLWVNGGLVGAHVGGKAKSGCGASSISTTRTSRICFCVCTTTNA